MVNPSQYNFSIYYKRLEKIPFFYCAIKYSLVCVEAGFSLLELILGLRVGRNDGPRLSGVGRRSLTVVSILCIHVVCFPHRAVQL